MRVLHLPTPIGGMPWGLAQGERALGLSSEVLVLLDHWLRYPSGRVVFRKPPGSLVGRFLGLAVLIREVYRIRNHYDVFHFNFGTSLIDLWKKNLPLLDVPFYKGKGKVIVTFNGCDIRQKYPTMKRVSFSACHDQNCYDGICNPERQDRLKRSKVSKFNRYADAMFAVNPDLMHFLPERTRFLPYTIHNWSAIEALPYQENKKRLKIVHSPTNRAAKGSATILKALENLKIRFKDRIEVTLVEKTPNEEARQAYAEADLAIDQILVGWYGVFAVEAMKMGVPVMAFLRKEDLHLIPGAMARECQGAIIQADPFSIEEKLSELIENPSLLRAYREAALEYVHKWHDPVYVAQITKSTYES